MLEVHPFWGYLLLQVRLLPVCELPTFAATDCIRHMVEAIYEVLAKEERPGPIPVTLTLPVGNPGAYQDTGPTVTVPGLADHGGGLDIHLPETLTSEDRDELTRNR